MIGLWDIDQDWRDALRTVEQRLPPDALQRLERVRVAMAPALKTYADAGPADIRLRPRPMCSSAAMVAIAAHEICHVLLLHHQALHSGAKSAQQIEDEADQLARRLGFGAELEARRFFFRR